MRYSINEMLHIIETDLDSVQLHKVIRDNPKLARRIRRALGLVRRLQHIYPQVNYSLYRRIINHQTENAKTQRFNWRRYKTLKELENYRKLQFYVADPKKDLFSGEST